jgi:subtilisin family serine protease
MPSHRSNTTVPAVQIERHVMRKIFSVLLSSGLFAATAFAGDGNVRRSEAPVPGSYIVVLASGAEVNDVAGSVKSRGRGRVQREYRRGIKALAVQMSDGDAQHLARDPRVAWVEEDSIVETTALPWGPDRIDQRSLPLDGAFNPDHNGSNVRVYVFDTGVSEHDEYSGRLLAGFNAIGDGLGTSDCNGHGTHVAGIIAGKNYGVAEGASIVPVRVLACDGKGSVSMLLSGIDFVIAAQAESAQPAVANFSLSGGASSALDAAVNQLIDAGVTTVIAAGNRGRNACDASPGRVSRALTVGATDTADNQATWSNYGGCVDIFAPGVGIVSASQTTFTGTATRSGTSQAAPFVAGVAAMVLEGNTGLSADDVAATVLSQATPYVVTGLTDPETPNRLACTLRSDGDTGTLVQQLISDPGFDEGDEFWTSEICTVINPTGCPPDELYGMSFSSHSGKSHASLGGRNREVHLLSESIAIPSNASSVELRLWLWVVTKERAGSANDVLTIDVRDAAGNILEELGTYSNLSESNTYRRHQFDMSAYRGKTIRIGFTSAPDRGAPTWFLLDDVELGARY